MQGMSLMDFFYLRDWIWKAGVGDPRENNTLLLTGPHSDVSELRTAADVAWLKRDLDKMRDEPVVYLGMHPGLPHASLSFLDPVLNDERCCTQTVSHPARMPCTHAWLQQRLDMKVIACCLFAGKVIRVRTLGPESAAEKKLRIVQESCLDRLFHISMDRVNYKASDRTELEEEQKEVLQEIKELENPEVMSNSINYLQGRDLYILKVGPSGRGCVPR